ncbi:hypothetical protein [Sulfurimonas sp.]|uniref:hypothetical protein n=1 Tax=Sulfurimonas sp. TaxID=2022749 RepID=UPI003D0FDEB7
MSLSNRILIRFLKLVVAIYGYRTKKKLYNKVKKPQVKPVQKQVINLEHLKQSNLSGCINYDKLKEAFLREYHLLHSSIVGSKI